MKNTLKVIVNILFVVVATIFISNPSKYMQSFVDGVLVWANNILPVLLPFALLSNLTIKYGYKSKYRICKSIFVLDCDEIFANSLLCGYPLGAKAIAQSNCDDDTAKYLSSFCSSAGPVFLVATIGNALNNDVATIIIVASHYFSLWTNSLVYRHFFKSKGIVVLPQTLRQDFAQTLTQSILSVISVGGLVALFYMLTNMICSYLPSYLQNNAFVYFLVGLLEMTNGILFFAKNCTTICATVLCSCLVSFGGVCILLQCYCFLCAKGVSAKSIFVRKATQGAFATITSYLLCLLFL